MRSCSAALDCFSPAVCYVAQIDAEGRVARVIPTCVAHRGDAVASATNRRPGSTATAKVVADPIIGEALFALFTAMEDLEEWHTTYTQNTVGGIEPGAACAGCCTCEETQPLIEATMKVLTG